MPNFANLVLKFLKVQYSFLSGLDSWNTAVFFSEKSGTCNVTETCMQKYQILSTKVLE